MKARDGTTLAFDGAEWHVMAFNGACRCRKEMMPPRRALLADDGIWWCITGLCWRMIAFDGVLMVRGGTKCLHDGA
jgi:hypothetical protein